MHTRLYIFLMVLAWKEKTNKLRGVLLARSFCLSRFSLVSPFPFLFACNLHNENTRTIFTARGDWRTNISIPSSWRLLKSKGYNSVTSLSASTAPASHRDTLLPALQMSSARHFYFKKK